MRDDVLEKGTEIDTAIQRKVGVPNSRVSWDVSYNIGEEMS